MSVVLITHHDENIYNIIKKGPELEKIKAYYGQSKFREKKTTTRFEKKYKKLHGTMGVPEEEPPDPSKFLKKHTGKPSYTIYKPVKQPKLCENLPHKDKTPTLEELKKQEQPIKSSKNFIASNIKVATNSKAKEPQHKLVVENTGRTVSVDAAAGPVYLKMSKYGKTPKYLVRFIQEKEKEYQKRKDASGEHAQPLCRYITRDQREELLQGLKQNWEELQKQYQGLPILTDTIPKILHKSKMEKDLKQLERDIVLIERHPYIYVYKDNELS